MPCDLTGNILKMWTLVKVRPLFLLYTGKGIDVSLRYWAKSTISKIHLSAYRGGEKKGGGREIEREVRPSGY